MNKKKTESPSSTGGAKTSQKRKQTSDVVNPLVFYPFLYELQQHILINSNKSSQIAATKAPLDEIQPAMDSNLQILENYAKVLPEETETSDSRISKFNESLQEAKAALVAVEVQLSNFRVEKDRRIAELEADGVHQSTPGIKQRNSAAMRRIEYRQNVKSRLLSQGMFKILETALEEAQKKISNLKSEYESIWGANSTCGGQTVASATLCEVEKLSNKMENIFEEMSNCEEWNEQQGKLGKCKASASGIVKNQLKDLKGLQKMEVDRSVKKKSKNAKGQVNFDLQMSSVCPPVKNQSRKLHQDVFCLQDSPTDYSVEGQSVYSEQNVRHFQDSLIDYSVGGQSMYSEQNVHSLQKSKVNHAQKIRLPQKSEDRKVKKKKGTRKNAEPGSKLSRNDVSVPMEGNPTEGLPGVNHFLCHESDDHEGNALQDLQIWLDSYFVPSDTIIIDSD